MCDQAENTGLDVPDDVVVFRACTKTTHFTDEGSGVAPGLFYKRETGDEDGLSFGITIQSAIKDLKTNRGAVKIKAGDIRGLNRGLRVIYDSNDATGAHVLIRQMPCYHRADEKQVAENVASELAFVSEIESRTAIPKDAPNVP